MNFLAEFLIKFDEYLKFQNIRKASFVVIKH